MGRNLAGLAAELGIGLLVHKRLLSCAEETGAWLALEIQEWLLDEAFQGAVLHAFGATGLCGGTGAKRPSLHPPHDR